MYGLRTINNGYADFAGTRGDFVVVGHPEFNLGKSRALYGYGPGWDTSKIPCYPARSQPGDRLRRAGVKNHINRLTDATPKPTYKERALARSASAPGSRLCGRMSDITDAEALEAFIEDVSTAKVLPSCGPARTTAGYANHIRSQPLCKHYTAVQDDLADLQSRLRMAPDATKNELKQEDCWKYYSSYLELGRRKEGHLRKERMKSLPNVKAAMLPSTKPDNLSLAAL
eukprot:TRINITY_DN72692_c0_g1_i1.p1 TRINITY_DN72692_c0_g1~~TRINITY_DN72692_c0_g1_i1.p1  ORF type:complete len:228 (-),score=29.95 TRINITY_DN72692_c0_g1_i1:119-802(-)